MSPSPFGTSFRRDPGESGTLRDRLDGELRERLEEAVDFACLDAMVQARRARGLPLPAADRDRDREEFTAIVREFLERLQRDFVTGPGEAASLGTRPGPVPPPDASVEALLARQAVLARELPDYWQRFDAIRAAYVAARARSGGERRGVLGRLLRRG
ncbi:MAG: hypothetical protein HY727_10550 [Candidatus Rokubacteria bacterium]|nr:hypothetical protein [Candidatus Rokubacteria bacterium]